MTCRGLCHDFLNVQHCVGLHSRSRGCGTPTSVSLCQLRPEQQHRQCAAKPVVPAAHHASHGTSLHSCLCSYCLRHCYSADTYSVSTSRYVSHSMSLYVLLSYTAMVQLQFLQHTVSVIECFFTLALTYIHRHGAVTRTVFTAHYVSHSMFLHSCSHLHTLPWCSYTYSFYCTLCQS